MELMGFQMLYCECNLSRCGEIGSDLISGQQQQSKTYLNRVRILFAFSACARVRKKEKEKLHKVDLLQFTALYQPY